MATKLDDWSIGDYLKHFRTEIDRSGEAQFKESFTKLTGELEQLDSEFLRESKGCSHGLDPILDRLHSLAGRLGYCERPRGYDDTCSTLYEDVDDAIDEVEKFRASCTD